MATINNSTANTLISGTSGDDSIYNYRGYSPMTINSGDEADTVENERTSSVTINTSEGDNFVYNAYEGDSVSINAGVGDDSVENYHGENVTIKTDAGNDCISLGSFSGNNVIQYAEGDSNDNVYGFKANDTLKIDGDTGSYSTQVSGNDIIVSVGDG